MCEICDSLPMNEADALRILQSNGGVSGHPGIRTAMTVLCNTVREFPWDSPAHLAALVVTPQNMVRSVPLPTWEEAMIEAEGDVVGAMKRMVLHIRRGDVQVVEDAEILLGVVLISEMFERTVSPEELVTAADLESVMQDPRTEEKRIAWLLAADASQCHLKQVRGEEDFGPIVDGSPGIRGTLMPFATLVYVLALTSATTV